MRNKQGSLSEEEEAGEVAGIRRALASFNAAGAMERVRMTEWKVDILLVDDEPRNILALKGLLEPLGENLLQANSGEEALRIMLQNDIAVVILDVRMPGMDGFETARLMRSRVRSRQIPIIFLTGVESEIDSALRGYEIGAVDYLVKPPVPEILRAKVAAFVALHRKQAELNREIADRRIVEKRLRESQTQLRALAARIESIREEERIGIAREIHDELGQVLTGLKMDITWLGKQLTPEQRPLQLKADAMCRLIDSTVQTVRRVSSRLRPQVLDEMGLVEAIRWQANEYQKRTGIRCRLDFPAQAVELPADLATALFRIFQELLTNVARHAKASSVDVILAVGEGRLLFAVADDGVGIDAVRSRGHDALGLLGIRERAQFHGGEVKIVGAPGRGTEVTILIPLPPEKIAGKK